MKNLESTPTYITDNSLKCIICNGEEIITDVRDGSGYDVICQCVIQRTEQQKLLSMFNNAQIPKRFANKTLTNFDASKQPAAHSVTKKYIQNWQENKNQGRGLFYTGPVGCGKTHLAFGTVNELIKKGVRSLAATVPDLMDDLRPQPGSNIDKKIEALKTVDLLVLDDLGAQRNTEWVTERIFVILNARYNNLLPTIITSNSYLEELERVHNWTRMVDRLLEMCELIEMKGTSFRLNLIKTN